MRTLSLLAILLTLILGTPISSISSEKKTDTPVISISEALKSPDGTPVILRGHISVVGKWLKDYILHNSGDKNNKIAVNIDEQMYKTVIVTPRATVLIRGNVNRSMFGKRTIDVKQLEIINK